MGDGPICADCGSLEDDTGCGCEETTMSMSIQAKCFRCGNPVDEDRKPDRVFLCGDCACKDWIVETDKGPVVWRSYSNPHPKPTRLVDPVECGLSEEDRETLGCLEYTLRLVVDFQVFAGRDGQKLADWVAVMQDLLDRLPKMIEDRDRELADAEYEALCARLEADTCRQILADALAKSNGSRDLSRSVTDGFENLAKTVSMAWDERDRLRDLVEFQKLEIRRLRALLDGESHG